MNRVNLTLREEVEDIEHIRTWEDVKQVFGGELEQVPSINKKWSSGVFGKVWKIKGKELALKITTDPDEMKVSRGLVGRNSKGFLNIYKVAELPPHKYKNNTVPRLMLKIQEFCYPIKDLDRLSFNSTFSMLLDDIMVNFDSEYKDVLTFKEFLQAVKEKIKPGYINEPPERFIADTSLAQQFIPFSKERVEKLINNESDQRRIIPFLVKFIDLVNRVEEDAQDVYELDIHVGNIMQTKKGIWKLVDF